MFKIIFWNKAKTLYFFVPFNACLFLIGVAPVSLYTSPLLTSEKDGVYLGERVEKREMMKNWIGELPRDGKNMELDACRNISSFVYIFPPAVFILSYFFLSFLIVTTFYWIIRLILLALLQQNCVFFLLRYGKTKSFFFI